MNAIVTDKKVKSGEIFHVVSTNDITSHTSSNESWYLDSADYFANAKYYVRFRNGNNILFSIVLRYLISESGYFTIVNVPKSGTSDTADFEVRYTRTSNELYTVTGTRNTILNQLFTIQEIGYFE